MKKNLLIAIVCVLGLFGSLNAQKTVTIGQGETSSSNIPYNNSYCYSASQQIYSYEELGFNFPAKIESIAFKSATENNNENYIQVYMVNTSKKSYANANEWIPVTEKDKVYEGYFKASGLNQWSKIELNTPFINPSDKNLMVCVNICYKYELSTNEQDRFYTYESSQDDLNYSLTLSADSFIDVTKINASTFEGEDSEFSSPLGSFKNQIQLVYTESDEIISNLNTINFGDIALGNYKNEKVEEPVVVSVASAYGYITSITCSDTSFFKMPKLELGNTTTVDFVLSYDKNATTAGEKTADIIVIDEYDLELVIPVKANVYEVVSPDVFELAKEITFTDGKFTDEPDSTKLYDDYLLPNERLDSYAPDAVYTLELEEESLVLVDIDGTNAKSALYAEDFGGKGYPSSDNAVTGRENIISTAFTYDFEDTKLDDFVIEDYDEFKDYTWKVENGTLVSYSFTTEGESYYDEDGNYNFIPDMNQAEERIITNTAYAITPNSVLTLDVNRIDNNTFLNLYVEVTKDGKEFIEMEWLYIPPNYYDEYTDIYGEYQVERRIDLGAKFAAMELEYGEYQISLYHSSEGGGAILVDNLTLTERTTVIPAGKYYLVAAAEDAFKVTVTLDEPKEEEPETPENPTDTIAPTPSDSLTLAAPVVTATATSDTTIVLTWNVVEGAATYNVYQGTDTVAIATAVKDTTYTVSGLKAETEYSFTVTAVNDTVESAKSAVVKATTLKGVDGIEELNAAISIYPNPVQNELFIATEVNVKEVAIYDIYGRQAMRQQVNETTSQQVVNVADLNSGIYFVKVVTDNGEIVKRFVKK